MLEIKDLDLLLLSILQDFEILEAKIRDRLAFAIRGNHIHDYQPGCGLQH